jgi:hypothetical protein
MSSRTHILKAQKNDWHSHHLREVVCLTLEESCDLNGRP